LQDATVERYLHDIEEKYNTPVEGCIKRLVNRSTDDANERQLAWLDTEIGLKSQLKTRMKEDIGLWRTKADSLVHAMAETGEKFEAKKEVTASEATKRVALARFDEEIGDLQLEKKKLAKPLIDRMPLADIKGKLRLMAVIKPAPDSALKAGGIYELFKKNGDYNELKKDEDGEEIPEQKIYPNLPQGDDARTWPNFTKKLGGYKSHVTAFQITCADSLIDGDRRKALKEAETQLRDRLGDDFELPELFQENFLLPMPA